MLRSSSPLAWQLRAVVVWGLVTGACQSNPYRIGGFADETCAAHPEAVFCSGFEQPDLSDWDQIVTTNTGSIEQTEALRRSGRGALHAATTDHESAGAVMVEFPALMSGELFLRAFLYVPDGLETKTTNVLFLGDEPAPDPFKGVDFNFEAGAPEVFIPENDPVRFTSTASLIPRDRWFCYQVQLSISEDAGRVQIRVDGDVALDVADLDTLPTGGVHQLRAGIDWSSKQMTPVEIYMDDLVLSRTGVDCGA